MKSTEDYLSDASRLRQASLEGTPDLLKYQAQLCSLEMEHMAVEIDRLRAKLKKKRRRIRELKEDVDYLQGEVSHHRRVCW